MKSLDRLWKNGRRIYFACNLICTYCVFTLNCAADGGLCELRLQEYRWCVLLFEVLHEGKRNKYNLFHNKPFHISRIMMHCGVWLISGNQQSQEEANCICSVVNFAISLKNHFVLEFCKLFGLYSDKGVFVLMASTRTIKEWRPNKFPLVYFLLIHKYYPPTGSVMTYTTTTTTHNASWFLKFIVKMHVTTKSS